MINEMIQEYKPTFVSFKGADNERFVIETDEYTLKHKVVTDLQVIKTKIESIILKFGTPENFDYNATDVYRDLKELLEGDDDK